MPTKTDMKRSDLTFKEENTLELLIKLYNETQNSFAAIDQKAMSILSASTIAISLITGFQLASDNPNEGLSLIGIILLLYLLFLACNIASFYPRKMMSEPITTDWTSIRQYLLKSDSNYYYELISGYKAAIEYNQKVVKDKTFWMQMSAMIMGFMTFSILALAAHFIST